MIAQLRRETDAQCHFFANSSGNAEGIADAFQLKRCEFSTEVLLLNHPRWGRFLISEPEGQMLDQRTCSR